MIKGVSLNGKSITWADVQKKAIYKCLECGNKLCYRDGEKNAKHFAHFGTENKCESIKKLNTSMRPVIKNNMFNPLTCKFKTCFVCGKKTSSQIKLGIYPLCRACDV
jgi:hypothetical protein